MPILDNSFKASKNVVIKVGSSSLTDVHGVKADFISDLAMQIRYLQDQGKHVACVISGAVAEGRNRLATQSTIPTDKRACASVGQMGVMSPFEQIFKRHGVLPGQLLVNEGQDIEASADAIRSAWQLNPRSVLLLNGNDAKFGNTLKNNDDVAAQLSVQLANDGKTSLVLITDQDGLCTADPSRDPEAQLVAKASAYDHTLPPMIGGISSTVGTGGMATKLLAAITAANGGVDTLIFNADSKASLMTAQNGKINGTLLRCQPVNPVVTERTPRTTQPVREPVMHRVRSYSHEIGR